MSLELKKSQIPLLKQARDDGKMAFFWHTKLIIRERSQQYRPGNGGNIMVRGHWPAVSEDSTLSGCGGDGHDEAAATTAVEADTTALSSGASGEAADAGNIPIRVDGANAAPRAAAGIWTGVLSAPGSEHAEVAARGGPQGSRASGLTLSVGAMQQHAKNIHSRERRASADDSQWDHQHFHWSGISGHVCDGAGGVPHGHQKLFPWHVLCLQLPFSDRGTVHHPFQPQCEPPVLCDVGPDGDSCGGSFAPARDSGSGPAPDLPGSRESRVRSAPH